MSAPVIQTENLTRRFDTTVAIDGLTLSIYPGEIFGLLGHNGAGKTTTVRVLNGLLKPQDGWSKVLDFDPATDGPSVRRRTGVLTETHALDGRLTVREALRHHGLIHGVKKPELHERIELFLSRLDLEEQGNERVRNLSKGMRQRVALARVFLHKPDLVFLDEPTAALDPVAQQNVYRLFKNFVRNQVRTAVICTHNLAEAQELCDRVGVLEQGRLIAIGTPAELALQFQDQHALLIETGIDYVEKAIQVLTQTNGGFSVSSEGAGLNVAGVPRHEIPKLIERLVQADVPVYQVSNQAATLSDFYFALHKRQDVPSPS